MDNYCFIDNKTFKVYENNPYGFSCDKKIANAVALLNKKGYITLASCEGHYEIGYLEQLNVDLDFLEEVKNDKRFIIKEIRDDGFDVWGEKVITSIYVSFKERYEFDNLPEGFIQDEAVDPKYNDRTVIRHVIEFYNDTGKRRRQQEVESEIDKYCNILKDWVELLPTKERIDE